MNCKPSNQSHVLCKFLFNYSSRHFYSSFFNHQTKYYIKWNYLVVKQSSPGLLVTSKFYYQLLLMRDRFLINFRKCDVMTLKLSFISEMYLLHAHKLKILLKLYNLQSNIHYLCYYMCIIKQLIVLVKALMSFCIQAQGKCNKSRKS